MKRLFSVLCAFVLCTSVRATTYYIDLAGNDSADGMTQETAWQSINRVNEHQIVPTDTFFFKANQTFNGSIIVDENDNCGNSGKQVKFTNYGSGRATIYSGMDNGFYSLNNGNIYIINLNFKGAGYNVTSKDTHGIFFYMDETCNASKKNITIINADASGYGGNGIYIASDAEAYGFDKVSLRGVNLFENGMGGFASTGSWDDPNSLIRYNHSNFTLTKVKAYKNHGRSEYKDNWSGSGILICGVVGANVSDCIAYENGDENGCTSAGPVGIWMDDCQNVVIEKCTSYRNKGGFGKKDGGGFDIDGGCQNSVIQDCISYENDGPGYAFFQWSTGNKWTDNIIRNCTSTNDARNPLYGAITLWGESGSYKVTNGQIYGNQISMDQDGKAIGFIGSNFSNVVISDNNFCLSGNAKYMPSTSKNATVKNSTFNCSSLNSSSIKVKRI